MILVTTLNTRTISSIWHAFLLYSRSSDEVYSAGDDKHNSCYPAGGESKGDCQYLDSSQIVSTFYMTQSTVGLHMLWSLIYSDGLYSASWAKYFQAECKYFYLTQLGCGCVRPGLGSGGQLAGWAGGELRYTGGGWASQAAPSDQPPTTLSSSTQINTPTTSHTVTVIKVSSYGHSCDYYSMCILSTVKSFPMQLISAVWLRSSLSWIFSFLWIL